MDAVLGWAYLLAIDIGLPCIFVWGLLRAYKARKRVDVLYAFSLAGFLFALSSQMLAIASTTYAKEIGGFAYYAPALMRIFRWGALLALTGLVLSIVGAWRANTLRWHALACSLGMLVFWFGAAMAESARVFYTLSPIPYTLLSSIVVIVEPEKQRRLRHGLRLRCQRRHLLIVIRCEFARDLHILLQLRNRVAPHNNRAHLP